MNPETEISRAITKRIRQLGGTVYVQSRKDPGGSRTPKTIPDLIVFYGTRFTFAEIKTAKGQLSIGQDGFRLACVDTDTPWQLWRSVEDAMTWIHE